ncbi:MAG: hypothetical protein ABJJ37_27170 [Roseibium sp.]
MQKENVGLQAFAAEVFKRDPELYDQAMVAAHKFVKTRKRHWLDRSRAGELEALDTANAVVGLMKLLGETDIQKIPDVAAMAVPGSKLHR